MVERFFRDVTTKRIRRGVFRSVTELKDAIADYVKKHNQNPKPYSGKGQASVAGPACPWLRSEETGSAAEH